VRDRAARGRATATAAGRDPRATATAAGATRLATLGDGVWGLWRDAPDPFPQRFSGAFNDDGRTIAGRWAQDGSNWETDFELTYRKVP
jgi:hypothetical protein